ncbi:MAG: fibrobacter succinogenes major paralogous domain-containing protein [Cryomorphaceae bacterium]|jgi:hypothetical protein|nr:fibrobacter succinogenes major paralogous domain-containing protein [Cryomorphaceae bacterium]
MTKYRCKNNPDHIYDNPTADFWCPQCDISTKPWLEPFEEDPVTTPFQNELDVDLSSDATFDVNPDVQIEPEPADPTAQSTDNQSSVGQDSQIDVIPLIVDDGQHATPVFICEEAIFGNQTWMLKYLSVTEFRNGERILHAKDDKEWNQAKASRTPAWCYSGVEGKEGKDHGILYNYYAVSHPAGLAPLGWRIPNLADVNELITANTKDFIKPHLNQFQEATMHHRLAMGSYNEVNDKRIFWTSEKKMIYTAFSFEVNGLTGNVRLRQYDKSAGFFVRCLKDNIHV